MDEPPTSISETALKNMFSGPYRPTALIAFCPTQLLAKKLETIILIVPAAARIICTGSRRNMSFLTIKRNLFPQ